LALATDRVSLGDHVLRVETAALVAATLMAASA
jgi:16S rRNA U1498 N3-methylase RsmE